MSYRPPGPLNKGNFAKTGHSSGGLSLLKITGDTGDDRLTDGTDHVVVDLFLEIQKLPDGRIQARRRDGRPLTDADRKRARQMANAMPGITPGDVLRIFPGARVLTAAEAAALVGDEEINR